MLSEWQGTRSGNYSGEEKHRYGPVFIARKDWKQLGISWAAPPITNRIVSMRVSAKPQNITIIQVYTPKSDHANQEVEDFYDKKENTIQKTHTR